ncbi:MAG: hypothetical protein CUN55_13725, partial [Phototrophicales bacterium]
MHIVGGLIRLDDVPLELDIVAKFHKVLCSSPLQNCIISHQKAAVFIHSSPDENQYNHLLVAHNAQLFNRDELIRTLCPAPQDNITTSEIIALAYDKWGTKCVDHFWGDFAFAIWDRAEQKLVLARDHVGVRSLFYLYCAPYFAFASNMNALKSLPFFNQVIDDEYIGAFLLKQRPPIEKTSFQQIRRLPSGHILEVSREKSPKVWSHWDLSATSIPQYSNEQRYIEEFYELFAQSVQMRMAGTTRIGAELSGGLDSSAVTAIAHHYHAQPLTTFSAIMPDVADSNEEATIRITANYVGVQPNFFRIDNVDLPALLQEMHPYIGDFYHAPNEFVVWILGKLARKQGFDVILTGHDGNTMLSDAERYASEVAFRGDWQLADQIISAVSMKMNPNELEKYRRNYFRQDLEPLLPLLLRKGDLRNFWRGLCTVQSVTQDSKIVLLARNITATLPINVKKRIVKRLLLWRRTFQHMNSEFVARLPARIIYPAPEIFLTERDAHIFSARQVMVNIASELREALSYGLGIDFRHPYADRRLIEYTLNLPPQLKIRDGWGRWVLRAAMQEKLPKEVLWPRSHTIMSHNFFHLIELHQKQLWDMANSSPNLQNYLRIEYFQPKPHQSLN